LFPTTSWLIFSFFSFFSPANHTASLIIAR
jgi:hypothetical protein